MFGSATKASSLGVLAAFLAAAFATACAKEASPALDETGESLDRAHSGARDAEDCTSTDGVPDDLRCTGLYSDWPTRTIAPAAAAFAPGFALWSDGAKKTRFIYLPKGTQIDARDMNSWVFPVGTKFWKEFRLETDASNGTPRLVETRMLYKTAPDKWIATTYVWSKEQDSARRVKNGIMPLPGTSDYEVPSERTCNRCHAGRADRVLGFEAVLLAAPEATGLTYDALVGRGLLKTTDGAAVPSAAALQIPGNPTERDAVGRLHANCGVACHHPTGPAPFSMRLDVINNAAPASIEQTSIFQEAIGQESFFTPDSGSGTYYRIRPTDEGASTIFYRLSHRDAPGGHEQMPPVATHRPDPELVESVRTWIRSMTDLPYPAPGPR